MFYVCVSLGRYQYPGSILYGSPVWDFQPLIKGVTPASKNWIQVRIKLDSNAEKNIINYMVQPGSSQVQDGFCRQFSELGQAQYDLKWNPIKTNWHFSELGHAQAWFDSNMESKQAWVELGFVARFLFRQYAPNHKSSMPTNYQQWVWPSKFQWRIHNKEKSFWGKRFKGNIADIIHSCNWMADQTQNCSHSCIVWHKIRPHVGIQKEKEHHGVWTGMGRQGTCSASCDPKGLKL